MTDPIPPDAFYCQYGKTVDQWAMLEYALSLWFQRLTGMKPDMSAAIFYSGRSFQTRKDLLLAALSKSDQPAEVNEFCKEAFKRAFAYSGTRNMIAHRMFVFDAAANVMRLHEGEEWWRGEGLDIKALAAMGTAFGSLTGLLMDVLRPERCQSPATPQEGLSRLRSLASRALSTPPAPTPSETPPRPQPSRG